MSDELLEGWISAPLDNLALAIQYGYTASAEPGGAGPRFLRITDIQDGRVEWNTVPGCTIDGAALDKYRLAPGDIMFARSGATTGKSFLIRHCPANAVFASYLIRVRPKLGVVMPEYLATFFQSKPYWEYITDNLAGNAQPNCNGTKLAALQVPVPPLAEQRRVVAKVEGLLAEVNRAKARLTKVQAILKQFRQSVLATACSGELTREWRSQRELPDMTQTIVRLTQTTASKVRRGVPEAVDRPETLEGYEHPEGWAEVSVAQALRSGLLIDVKDGNHGANHPKVAEFGRNGLAFITAAQVGTFSIDYDGAYKIAGAPLKKLRVGFAQPGDAILTHKGSVGRAALCDRPCVLTPQTTYYRPNPALVDGEYLTYWFASLWFYGQLSAVMSQTTRDFVPISEQYRLFLVLPSLEEQREIARRVRGLLALASGVEAKVNATVRRCDRLPQAILSKAFSGELVPTEAELARLEGREYESAAMALERVTKEAETAATTVKRSQRRRQQPVSA